MNKVIITLAIIMGCISIIFVVGSLALDLLPILLPAIGFLLGFSLMVFIALKWSSFICGVMKAEKEKKENENLHE